jgi:pentalenolactone synthase
VAAIDRGVLLLLTNPHQRDALERDPDRLKQAVEEILRHPGPLRPSEARAGGGIPRYANADLDVAGVTIKAGDLVLLGLRAANQDEDRFARPQEFDVAREQNAHLTFGHGPHFCLGAPLARLELQTVFGTLLRRFPGLRLARPVEELQTRSHLLTGGVAELPVNW